MRLIELNLFYADGREVIVGSWEQAISENSYKHILETKDEYGDLHFEGEINETIELVLVRFVEYYRENMRNKLTDFFRGFEIKTEILAILN